MNDFTEHRVRELETFEARARGENEKPRPPVRFRSINHPGESAMLAANEQPRPARRGAAAPSQAVVVHTPLSIVQAALASGNIEMYREAVALAKEMDAITARKAFDNALADAKANMPVIRKNRRVGFDSRKSGGARTDYAHEDMAEIARTIDPVLSANGLSYRFRVSSEVNEPVRVTCVISHRDGHSEETTLSAGRDDDSSNKNTLQRIGSTVTYLQRYTLKAALGLAASEDDDGRGGEAKVAVPVPAGCISPAQAEEIRSLLDTRGVSHRAFLQFIRLPSIEAIGIEHFDRAVAKIKSFGGRS